ncbi:MAG: chromosome segregation protein SMC [Lachnospiraceae bacterium]|nr:chromosome segregation protein SMC [Lachnospiraceae bacterium]
MYLKSIEVHGFKSFANKMVFRFQSGITGIVGPNGSGKSNVADAVRWVLGEQSARQLRGSKMEDVIFSGTELRKPMGSAYVAITLDNSDHSLPVSFDEVTVARRVYRSGESEYLLNNSVCRRKDIVEMFFDTGIGKEGYSIIGQGQVEKILNGKPEERRELFDEAAGIIKYKKNKLTAEKSLEKERENLTRVNDILSELTDRVEPLKEQSAKAKDYLQYRDSLKNADIQMFLLEQTKMQDENADVTNHIQVIERDIHDGRIRYERTKSKNDALEQELSDLRTAIDEQTDKLQQEKVEKEKLEGEINVLNEQIKTEKTKEEHYYSNVSRVEMELDGKRRQMAEVLRQQEQILVRQKQNAQKEKEERWALDAVEQQKAEIERQLDEILGHIKGMAEDQTEISNKMEHFATVREQLALRIEDLDKRLNENKREYDKIWESRDIYDRKLKELQQLEITTASKMKEALEQRSELIRKGNQLSQKGEDKKQEIFRIQSRLETLKNMAERYDGYGNSIRRVMEQRTHNPGIIGVVADIVKVEKQYEIAIETALGGSIQNIVTDNEQTAKCMIAFLKEKKYGRATFLPLNAVKNRYPFRQEQALKEPGVIGLASSLVQTEKRFEQLVDSLLGRIVIVDTIDHAIALARSYHYSMRIVTLGGESFNPGGAMTGGAFKHSSNLLARNREISEAKRLENQKKKEYLELKSQYDSIAEEKDSLEKQISIWEKEDQERSLDINTVVLNKQQMENRCQEIERIRDDLEKEKASLEEDKKSMTENVRNLLDKKKGLEEQNQSRESLQKELEKQLEHLKEREEHHVGELSEVQLQANSYEQQMNFSKENENRVQEEIERLEYDLKEIKEDASDREDMVEHIENRITEIHKRIHELNKQVMDGEVALKKAQQSEKQKNQQYKHSMEDRESLSRHMAALDKEIYRLQSRKEKLDEKIQNLTDYMWESYEMTYRMAKDQWKDEITMSVSDLKKEIGKWKHKIKNLGSININAIEEYKEVSERYEFLLNQHDDIVKAEGQLVNLIRELETEMRKQFKDKFCDIQEMFASVFKELFGGGHAKLELTEDEDVLEAGIQIIAQPPGKKLQNMMQLSGGEKALTAISLLFAIQSLKPSPFCLLDEIEAALDDSNVGRFSQYLHKLTKDTQFIVITHRKGTMTAADMLYGITMQEKGVSTLVSVNLIENDLDD